MRYDTPIYFNKLTEGAYNAETGDYDAPKVSCEKRYCALVATSDEMMTLVYGALKEGSLTVHLQRPYGKLFDEVAVHGKIYRVDFGRNLRVKKMFIMSEVL